MNIRPKLPDDIKELVALVRAGKLFEVQKWIADGKRTMPPKPYRSCPIGVAVEIGFHSMVEVLLEAGIVTVSKSVSKKVWESYPRWFQIILELLRKSHIIDWKH